MNKKDRSRSDRLLTAAEGYMTLEMYTHALASLDRIEGPNKEGFEANYLRGDALRNLGRHEEALEAFHRASEAKPDDVSLLMAMAWCCKRTNRLPRAITLMEQAYKIAPKEAVILYNLSCYWSLAGNKTQSLSWLGRALRMDASFRQLIDDESDFDPLRHDPDFQMIVSAVQQAE